jgi:hypothetical protein
LRVKARLCHNALNAVWDPNTLAGPKLKKKRTKTKQKPKFSGRVKVTPVPPTDAL